MTATEQEPTPVENYAVVDAVVERCPKGSDDGSIVIALRREMRSAGIEPAEPLFGAYLAAVHARMMQRGDRADWTVG